MDISRNAVRCTTHERGHHFSVANIDVDPAFAHLEARALERAMVTHGALAWAIAAVVCGLMGQLA